MPSPSLKSPRVADQDETLLQPSQQSSARIQGLHKVYQAGAAQTGVAAMAGLRRPASSSRVENKDEDKNMRARGASSDGDLILGDDEAWCVVGFRLLLNTPQTSTPKLRFNAAPREPIWEISDWL